MLHGCVVIPQDYRPGKEETIREKSEFRFIHETATGREQVEQSLGRPDWSFQQGHRWIYTTGTDLSGSMPWCVGFTLGVGAGGKCSAPERDFELELVELLFDESGVVQKLEFSSVRPGLCTQSEVCLERFDGGGVLTVDGVSKRYVPVKPGECSLVVYTKESEPLELQLVVDSLVVTSYKLSRYQFLLKSLGTGPHSIEAIFEGTSSGTQSFGCDDGSLHFLRVRRDESSKIAAGVMAEDVGRQDIIDKWQIAIDE
jgi:hypothetical protein